MKQKVHGGDSIPICLHRTKNKYEESVFNGKIGKFKDFKIKLHIDKQINWLHNLRDVFLSHSERNFKKTYKDLNNKIL